MNVGFDEDEKTLCIFDDGNGGVLVGELGYKITKSICDGCEECIISNPYEDYFLDKCPYGVDDDLRLTY